MSGRQTAVFSLATRIRGGVLVTHSVRQISFVACFFLVLLRVSIGWQFLYEGLWKHKTYQTSQPWTAEGYLKNARGPFRDTFRDMVGDPDSLDKLDYDKMAAMWDDWHQRFLAHHPDLDDVQKLHIDGLLNGTPLFYENLAALPAGVDLKKFKPTKPPKDGYVKFDAKERRLETNLHLLPEERDALVKMAESQDTDDQAKKDSVTKYQIAINKLYQRSSKLSLKERLQVLLKEDPERVGVILESHEGTVDHKRLGKIQVYKNLLERYERNLAGVQVGFQHDHLSNQWGEIQEKRAELVGPVDALTTELHSTAAKELTLKQSQRGPVPASPTKISEINQMTIWSLIILGALMMAGLFSRLSALGAAGLLLMFYLPIPPWPGVPEAPGPEHSLIVNKNLIECIACLALAFMPTGRWVGLDALVRRFIFFRKTD